jgi:hypothetical protein
MGDQSTRKKDKKPKGTTPKPSTNECARGKNWCFDHDSIQAAAASCVGQLNPTCGLNPGVQVYLLLSCDPGGQLPPGVVGIYLVNGTETNPETNYCSGTDVFNDPANTASSLNAQQIQKCEDAITESGYCE